VSRIRRLTFTKEHDMSTARKPGTLHRLSLAAAMIAVASAPLALAPAASATTTANGCSVNPLAPTFAGRNGAGTKIVRYNVVIACGANRTVEVQQSVFEDDPVGDPDDFIDTQVVTRVFTGAAITTRGFTLAVPDTEAGAEELYQRARFRVTPAGGLPTVWTAFESGPVLPITN
jgi:hypothetical protein